MKSIKISVISRKGTRNVQSPRKYPITRSTCRRNNIFLVQGRMRGQSVIDPTGSGRVDGRLRSSNSRNETSGQFRVIGKSGRCFRAIPWLVTAYHRVARQPTAPNTRAGLFLYSSFQEGFARSPLSSSLSPPVFDPTSPLPVRSAPPRRAA